MSTMSFHIFLCLYLALLIVFIVIHVLHQLTSQPEQWTFYIKPKKKKKRKQFRKKKNDQESALHDLINLTGGMLQWINESRNTQQRSAQEEIDLQRWLVQHNCPRDVFNRAREQQKELARVQGPPLDQCGRPVPLDFATKFRLRTEYGYERIVDELPPPPPPPPTPPPEEEEELAPQRKRLRRRILRSRTPSPQPAQPPPEAPTPPPTPRHTAPSTPPDLPADLAEPENEESTGTTGGYMSIPNAIFEAAEGTERDVWRNGD